MIFLKKLLSFLPFSKLETLWVIYYQNIYQLKFKQVGAFLGYVILLKVWTKKIEDVKDVILYFQILHVGFARGILSKIVWSLSNG